MMKREDVKTIISDSEHLIYSDIQQVRQMAREWLKMREVLEEITSFRHVWGTEPMVTINHLQGLAEKALSEDGETK